MRNIMQAVLSFLLNGGWQIAAVALVSVLGSDLLGSVTRYRHVVWVAALALSLMLPLISAAALQTFETSTALSNLNQPLAIAPAALPELTRPVSESAGSGFHVSGRLAIVLLTVYLLLICYRSA